MEFEWDENKNRENIKKHGISFEEATAIFERPVWARIDDRHDYGEVREVSIGDIGNFVIVFASLSGLLRKPPYRIHRKKQEDTY